MPEKSDRPGNRLMDRPEYRLKQQPLTCLPTTSVFEAVLKMSEKNYGAVIVINDEKKVIGIVTERDVMNKVVANELDVHATVLTDIMTENPRVARETDDLIDWLRIMSNERFRRLPVIDDNGQIKAVFTQGDFVSYTWPDLIFHASQMAKASFMKGFTINTMLIGMFIYGVAMIAAIKAFV